MTRAQTPHFQLDEEELVSRIPPELKSCLDDAADRNSNYALTALSASVRREVEAALLDPKSERAVGLLVTTLRARIAQYCDNLLWNSRRRGSTQKEIAAAPRTLFKSAQEVFTS